MALNYLTVTGTFDDGSGNPLPLTGQTAYCLFTPNQAVYASGIPVITPAQPIQAPIVNGALVGETGGALRLLATDNSGLSFGTLTGFFYWTVTIFIASQVQSQFSFFLPYATYGGSPYNGTVDLSKLANTNAGGGSVSFPITIGQGGTGQTTAPLALAALGGLPVAGGAMTGALAPAVAALTDGATISLNAQLGNVFTVTLAGNRTLANPTNPAAGQTIHVHVTQDATGSRTLSYGTAYDFGTNGAPTLTTTAGKMDILGFTYDPNLAKLCYIGAGQGF